MFRKLKDWTLHWAGSRHADTALVLVSFAESSVFPIPTEVLFVPMCLARPERAYRYAAIATLASVLGGFLVAPLVTRDLRRIFLHRHRSLAAHFPGCGAADPVIDIG